jgi:hypothetical protein
MGERLICSSAVCRRDRSARRIALGDQKCCRTRSKSGVLSGFPTALEPTLRRFSLVTNLSTLPSDRKAGQLLVPRDDIPPPSVVVALGI